MELVDNPLYPIDKTRNVGVDSGKVLTGAADAPRDETDQRGAVVLLHRQRTARIPLEQNRTLVWLTPSSGKFYYYYDQTVRYPLSLKKIVK